MTTPPTIVIKAQRTVHQVENLDGQIDQHEVREIRGRRDDRQTGAAVHSPVLGEGVAAQDNGGQRFRLF